MGQITNPSSGGSGGGLINVQILTGAGTYTPTPGAVSAYVDAQAPGGGSGGLSAGAGATGGVATGGGSSGGRARLYIPSLASSYAYDCGTAGAAGGAGTAGGNATALTFGGLLNVPGGLGSAGDDGSSGDAPALPTGGDINIAGQAGSEAVFELSSGIFFSGGLGGQSALGTVGKPGSQLSGATGPAPIGSGYGAGASGSFENTIAASNGQQGLPGIIFVYEYG